MMKRYSIALFLLFAVTFSAYAQYGKISGLVTDRETKEPLIGANVLLEGTSLGASTDVNGTYTILNVPAGTYTMKTTYVGYQPTTITGVSVLAGLTRDMNVQLASTAVQLNAVEIVAERPLIEKTATNAVRITTTQDIANLPVRGVQNYFALQPGVVVQNGVAYVRGSRAGEVGYMVEGADVKDIVGATDVTGTAGRTSTGTNPNPGSLVTIIPEALQQVGLQAGGYGADLGGSNGGIIQQTLRTGGSSMRLTLQGETDNFGNYPGKKVLGAYSSGYSDYVVTLSTPVVGDKVKLFVAGENSFQRDLSPTFFSGAELGYMKSTYDATGRTYDDPSTADSVNMSWPAGNVLGRMNNRYTTNGTLLFDLMPLQVRLGGAFTWARNMNNNLIRNYFDLGRVGVNDNSNLLLNGKFNYFFTPKTFAEVNVNYLDRRTKGYDPALGDNVMGYGDSVANYQHGYQFISLIQGPNSYNFSGFPFTRRGAVLVNFGKSLTTDLSGSVAITSQMENHSLNVGGSYEYWSVSSYGNVGAGTYGAFLTDPNGARDPVEAAHILRQQQFVNNYGYDEFGNPLSSGPDGPKHPFFGAGYVQDRIEFSDLNINVGLRYDVMNMDDFAYSKVDDLGYNVTDYLITTPGKSKTYSYVEPRLGFSFPASDRTVFHLQYGKFVQAPPLYTAYASRANALRYLFGGNYFLAPIGYNLQPVRTTQYELGFSQQFTEAAAFDVTGFYKNTQGQIQYAFFPAAPGSVVPNFFAYTNGDFETVSGLEFSLRLRRTSRVQAEINYTLQDARGTGSFENSGSALANVAGNTVKPSMVVPLNYGETHRGSVSLDYRWDKGDGGAILERLGLNLLLTFNSGHPFTLSNGSGGQQGPDLGSILNDLDARTRFPAEPVNASTTPWFYQLDFRLDKTISLNVVDLNIYVYVQNLLNTQNVINVYYRTGNAYDDGWLSDPTASGSIVKANGAEYVALYQVMNLQNNQNQLRQNGFTNFGMPRQIRVGAKLEF